MRQMKKEKAERNVESAILSLREENGLRSISDLRETRGKAALKLTRFVPLAALTLQRPSPPTPTLCS